MLAVNQTCPGGIRGFIRSTCGNGDDYHTACLDVLETFAVEGNRTVTLDELGDVFSEREISEVLRFLEV